ncbi:hypothetical protein [Galbitalea soli]|uniref:Lipoprotein n=1 Tax=Galbitalea soli TaxID=1268042 RepID=A0A7C9TR82_9MICO|nr:hypothetical protein [Galbitalea soli]NEM90843.1 hypothetical protein [Galbitalea soli]NYJ31563.1 hypothetical protein [Galbitalea soli]
MLSRSNATAAALLLTLALLLQGCTDAPPRPLHLTPAATHTIASATTAAEPPLPRQLPVSVASTDAEVLAAATNAYTGYVLAAERLMHGSDTDLQILRDWTTTKFGDSEIEGTRAWLAKGKRLVGASVVSDFHLLDRQSKGGVVIAVVFSCVDLSHTRVVTKTVQPTARPSDTTKLTMQVSVRQSQPGVARLAVDGVVALAKVDRC